MNALHQANYRQGSIIIITLILLSVMTTMGVGLLHSTKKTAQQVGRSVDRVGLLYSAESCIVEAVQWLENAATSGVPCKSGSCFNSNQKSMSKWELNSEWSGDKKSQAHKNKISKQKYICSVEWLGEDTSDSAAGIGFDVGSSSSYGGAVTSTKHLYKITSTGFNDGKVRAKVEVIASLIF
jgi:Tfp pilus assembly protein PilX